MDIWKAALAAMLLTASSGTTSTAATYLKVNETQTSVGYVDMAAVTSKGDERIAWLIIVAKGSPSVFTDKADLVALQMRYDCRAGMVQTIANLRFAPDRRPLLISDRTGPKLHVSPGFPDARVLEAVCHPQTVSDGAILRMPPGSGMFDLSRFVKRQVELAGGPEPLRPPPFTPDPKGWRYLVSSPDRESIVFIRGADYLPGGYPRMWVRWEHKQPNSLQGWSYHSVAELHEYDCGQGGYRLAQQTFYAQNGLTGEAKPVYAPANAFDYATPGTIAASIVHAGCTVAIREKPPTQPGTRR